MGDWNINIQGVGAHGNGIKGDVEQLFKGFVAELEKYGHHIVNSTVTYGGAYHRISDIPTTKEGDEK